MPDTWNDLDQQVVVLLREGRLAEAAQVAERTLALVEHALGPVHPEVALHLNTLGALHRLQCRSSRANRSIDP